MKHIRHSATVICALLASAFGLVVGAPAAFAVRLAPPAGSGGSASTSASTSAAGMAGWEIAVIAVAAAVVASLLTAAATRLRFRSALHAAAA